MDAQKKKGRYQRLYRQIEELITPIANPLSRMATISAILHHKMDYFFWTGFYLFREGELEVVSYQGPLACLRLKKHIGVCWAGIDQAETVVVQDVDQYPGHIACSSQSKSEIVVPVRNQKNEVVGVLDVDSRVLNSFDQVDKEEMEKIISLIYKGL